MALITKKTIVIDNYDSFVFNLVQYTGELGGNPEIYRNDAITLEEIIAKNPTHIIISPGPDTLPIYIILEFHHKLFWNLAKPFLFLECALDIKE